MKSTLVFIVCVIVMFSCKDKENVEPIGLWDDNIKLSQKRVEFSHLGDSISIEAEGAGWWINSVSFNDSVYLPPTPFNSPFESYAITSSSFKVEHLDEHHIIIKMKANESTQQQELEIVVQGGNYFDYIHVSLSAK